MTNDNQRNLLVMKASAGSGKTYNLALQYIKQLLFTTGEGGRLVPRRAPGDERILNAHRQLLAITFTNKATDEMKERIVTELYNLALPGAESDYLDGFISQSGLSEEEVRSLARQALNELLFDYSNFNVSTIDSFFQTILRNFARELDRDFNYDIELEEKYAVRVAIHNFLLSLGQEGKPTQVDKWVQEYQRHQMRGDAQKKSWRFFEDGGSFFKFAKQMNSELFRNKMDEIRDYLGHTDDNGEFVNDFSKITAFKQFIHGTIESINDDVNQVLDELRRELQPFASGLRYSLKNWFFDEDVHKPLTDSLLGADLDKIATQFKVDVKPSTDVLERVQQLVKRFYDIRLYIPYYEKVESKLGLLGLIAMVDVFLERYRHETNSILIGDTNQLIGTVLDSGSPFVYERVGTMISHFMIDEFQDTSTKQYENFRGLLQESLANGNFNMLIGDAKQSIYRFRNADPTVFREKVNADFARDYYMPPVKDGAPSSVNYRSSRNIVEFNNSLFEFVRQRYTGNTAVEITYQDVKQGLPDNVDVKKVPGYVRVITDNYSFFTGIEQDGQPDVLEILPDYLLKLHERYPWGKIGILVNANSESNKIVEHILQHNRTNPDRRIDIISGESLLLSNSSVVRRIITMLRFIDISQYGTNDEDDEAAADLKDKYIARRLKKEASDQRLYTILGEFIKRQDPELSHDADANGRILEECLQDLDSNGASMGEAGDAADDRFQGLLQRLLPPGDELATLVSIVETIIAYFRAEQAQGSDVDRETAFLLAFQDTVMQFSSMRNGGTIREFLKFWDEKKGTLSVNSPSSSDAINIMTIHKAKGLEFDCVVIPYATWELNNSKREVEYWMPREAFMDTLVPPYICDEELVPPLMNVNKSALAKLYDNGQLGPRARAFVEEQRSAVIIDKLNKTYVAFTRPRSELHLFCGTTDNDLRSLLRDFAADENSALSAILDAQGEPTGWYERGVMSSREELDSKRNEKPVKAIQCPISQYRVSDTTLDLGVRVDHASSSCIDSGIRLHSVMSGIRDRGDAQRVIAAAIKHGVITSDEDDPCSVDNVNEHVLRPILDEKCRAAAWFDPANKVYNERTITTLSDNIWAKDGIENVRPDRIILRPDGQIIVIDYKSGQRNDKEHLNKLNKYMRNVRAVFPGVPVVGRLWYTTLDLILDHNGKPLSYNLP